MPTFVEIKSCLGGRAKDVPMVSACVRVYVRRLSLVGADVGSAKRGCLHYGLHSAVLLKVSC